MSFEVVKARRTLAVVVAGVGLAGTFAASNALAATPGAVSSASGVTRLESVALDGSTGNNDSADPALSADGRYVAFDSRAFDLVEGDAVHFQDVFVRDEAAMATERVSVGLDGAPSNGESSSPAVSANGRYVAFSSVASNLVAGDTNVDHDAFVRDRVAGVTERVSLGTDGIEGDGATVATGVSANGRYVVMLSEATNLVPDDTNGQQDVFVRDRVAGVTERVSVGPGDVQSNGASPTAAISADGRYVAFESGATNLVAGDTNAQTDVFVRDRVSGVTERVSLGPGGIQGDRASAHPAISAHGRYVVFDSRATNLVAGDQAGRIDVFVRDRATGMTSRISTGRGGAEANGVSQSPVISSLGKYVAFASGASNLVRGDTNRQQDVFVFNRSTGVTQRVSVGPGGRQANNFSARPSISGHGRDVAFYTTASNLVAGDTNGVTDVFTRVRW